MDSDKIQAQQSTLPELIRKMLKGSCLSRFSFLPRIWQPLGPLLKVKLLSFPAARSSV